MDTLGPENGKDFSLFLLYIEVSSFRDLKCIADTCWDQKLS